eukprot:gene24765-4284_t
MRIPWAWGAGVAAAVPPSRAALLAAPAACVAAAGATHLTATPRFLAALGDTTATPSPLAARWAGRVRLLNAYGVTECVAYHCRLLFAAGDGADPLTPPTADGAEAEVWVGSGYLRAPDLTAARFVDHAALGWVFRAGDVAVRGECGAISGAACGVWRGALAPSAAAEAATPDGAAASRAVEEAWVAEMGPAVLLNCSVSQLSGLGGDSLTALRVCRRLRTALTPAPDEK